MAPDLDALSLLFGQDAYADYHHYLLHNLSFGAAVTALSARWVGRRPASLVLVFVTFLSHLVGDYCGSGPGWPLWPFRPLLATMFYCQRAWELVSWQNTTITAVAIAITLVIAVRYGYTPLETVLPAVDRVVVEALRLRFTTIPCRACGTRAWFRCAGCGEPFCEAHARAISRITRRCALCAEASA